MKPITLKLEEKQDRLLESVARETHVPKSALIRKGIDLILRQAQEDVISVELRREIDSLLKEDHTLLQRLARS